MIATPRPARAIFANAALAVFYGLAFSCLTYPRIREFSSHFWADLGDGMENVWNLWWVKEAVIDLHQSPWHTIHLHHPFGMSLHAHALSAFNGFLAIPLSAWLSPVETHNAIVLFAFTASGITAFWLAHAVTGSAVAGLIAGYVFAFSAFHFAHTGAHLNLVSIEWLPLHLLCWLRLLERPSSGRALAAALSLFAIYLCDYYYFAYALLASVWFAAYEAWRRREWLFLARGEYRRPLAVFALAFALSSGVLIAAGVRAYLESPFVGGHDPAVLSLDLLAPFVPGGDSRFAGRTTWFWKTIRGNVNENSVFLGISTIVLAACAFADRRRSFGLGRWSGLVVLFAVLALGPRLQVFGEEVPGLVLPYGWIETLVPAVRLSGVPIRAFVMVTLAAAVLAAAGASALAGRGGGSRAFAVLLFVVLVIETLPGPIPASPPPPSGFASSLAAKPEGSAYVEIAEPPLPNGIALYLQTIHQRPMAFGHTSRVTAAVAAGERRLRELIRARELRALHCDYGFRYALADEHQVLEAPAESVELWQGRRGRLYDLGRGFGCAKP
ncbi:MAG: hypothetical protein ACREQQ_17645 [Candidatus Binatia bacterium]